MDDYKKLPLVSILIPMYNAYPYIKDMLDSILSQTYKNWELIIVDDGSTDESINLVKLYALSDNRIKLIQRSPSRMKGANSCRNIGYENSVGEYVIWLDADDIIAPYCLEQRVVFMTEHPTIDFAVFPSLAFYKNIGDSDYCLGYNEPGKNENINFLLANVPNFQVVTNIYRRQSLEKHKILWDEHLLGHQDVDMNLEVLYNSLNFLISGQNKPDYFYRLSGNTNSIAKGLFSKNKASNNAYYFNKQVKRFFNNKNINLQNNLIYLYEGLLYSKENKALNMLLKSNFFNKHYILKIKLQLIVLFHKLFKNNNLTRCLIILFCPQIKYNYHKIQIKQRNNREHLFYKLEENFKDINIAI